jgi:hypothetical protein
MESKVIQRRLAVILAADVAGYSRLMGGDEIGTLTPQKAHRHEQTDPLIASAAHQASAGMDCGEVAPISENLLYSDWAFFVWVRHNLHNLTASSAEYAAALTG